MTQNNPVMILGGYGNFGKRIATALAQKNIYVLIVGRDPEKARQLAAQIGPKASALSFNVNEQLDQYLAQYRPSVIVNTIGPFQHKSYDVAKAAIKAGIHYIDLADGREFVANIGQLDVAAKAANIGIISGASTVPTLSDAVVTHYRDEFHKIENLQYGISPGQGAERGLATTKAILSYVGKPLAPFPSVTLKAYGWQNLYRQIYPGLGKRWMANCEVPDLDLLPARHQIDTIQFSAGLELSIMHLGLWALGWLVRLGLPIKLERHAALLLKASNLFNRFGSSEGGMHVTLRGTAAANPDQAHMRQWFIIAKNGDGPHIPTIPAIILAEKIAKGAKLPAGAYPCVEIVTLDEYLNELSHLDIEVIVSRQNLIDRLM